MTKTKVSRTKTYAKECLVLPALFLCSFLSAKEATPFDFTGTGGESVNISNELKSNSGNIAFDFQAVKSPKEKGIKITVKSESGQWVEVEPVITDKGELHYTFLPNAEIETMMWCRSEKPEIYTDYWQAKALYRNLTSYGGHNHSNPPPPKLQSQAGYDLPNPVYSGQWPVNQDFVIKWKASGFSTRITAELTWTGSCDGVDTILYDIKQVKNLKDLVEMGPGTGYDLTGVTTAHPKNHYVTSTFKTVLENIAKNWKETCPKSTDTLKYNDMSLVWGGKFDLDLGWGVNPKESHQGHLFGNNADVSKKWVRKGNRAKLVEMMCKYVDVYSEGDSPTEPFPHYHLALKGSKHPEDYPDPSDTRIIPCCPTPSQACIDLQSNGVEFPEPLPLEGNCE